jgi:alpha,alpha-trehalase
MISLISIILLSLIINCFSENDDTFTSMNSSTNIAKACTIFCKGDVLHYVQISGIFNDSKTFVDMPMKVDPEEILDAFNLLPNYDKTTMLDFVNTYFLPAGSDLNDWIPNDYTINPSFLDNIPDPYNNWASDLNKLWLELGRELNSSVLENPQRHSYIPQPYPLMVPGGRFRESYYWDSYWIIRGLLVCDMHETALGVIMNLLTDIENFGFVPNGGRIYYLDRSQPPLLSEMVITYVTYMIDNDDGINNNITSFLNYAYPLLKIEYGYWMSPRHSVKIYTNDINSPEVTLNRYHSNSSIPRPESYTEDYSNGESFNNSVDVSQFYNMIRSGAETGWDFSSRWIWETGIIYN